MRQTRVSTLTRGLTRFRANFRIDTFVYDVIGPKQRKLDLDEEAPKKCPHGKSGCESTDVTQGVVPWLVSVGGKPDPSTSARARTWAKVSMRPPTHCVNK